MELKSKQSILKENLKSKLLSSQMLNTDNVRLCKALWAPGGGDNSVTLSKCTPFTMMK